MWSVEQSIMRVKTVEFINNDNNNSPKIVFCFIKRFYLEFWNQQWCTKIEI